MGRGMRPPADVNATGSSVGLDAIERLAVCAAVFALVALNGQPAILSSGPMCLAIAVGLLTHRLVKRGGALVVSRRQSPMLLIFALWTFVAALSAVAAGDPEGVWNWAFGYFTPLLLFASLAGLRPSRTDLAWMVLAMAAAALLRFGLAGVVFVSGWGLLSLDALLMAHFNVPRMQPYMAVTFGSTSQTASLVVVILPVLLVSLFVLPFRAIGRGLILTAAAATGLNVLITGSRGAVLVLIAVAGFAAFRLRSRWRYAMLLALTVGVALFVSAAGEAILERFSTAARLDMLEDASVRERWVSIEHGLGIIREYPLGVGPGLSYHYNPHHTPHQFAVSQGSDIGLAGMIAVIVLTVLVLARSFGPGRDRTAGPELAFLVGALSWLAYAMSTNIPLNMSATVAWVGLLVVFLAFSAPATVKSSTPRRWRRVQFHPREVPRAAPHPARSGPTVAARR